MERGRGWWSSRYKQNIVEFDRMWRLAAVGWAKREIDDNTHEILYTSEVDVCVVNGKTGSERRPVRIARNLLDWADYVIAHNAKFDVGKLRAKFVEYELDPPANYEVICTYNITRPMGFPSKKLDDLANFLNLPQRKLPTGGKDTWMAAEEGDPDALQIMGEYNACDVEILIALYDRVAKYSTKLTKPVVKSVVPEGAQVSPKTGVLGVRAQRALLSKLV